MQTVPWELTPQRCSSFSPSYKYGATVELRGLNLKPASDCNTKSGSPRRTSGDLRDRLKDAEGGRGGGSLFSELFLQTVVNSHTDADVAS